MITYLTIALAITTAYYYLKSLYFRRLTTGMIHHIEAAALTTDAYLQALDHRLSETLAHLAQGSMSDRKATLDYIKEEVEKKQPLKDLTKYYYDQGAQGEVKK